MAEPRIQLWTDHTNSEFAIYLNSDYVIRTNQKIKYTKMIDESVCMQGYNYDWKHTLTQWVTFLFGNNLQISPEKFEISDSPLDLIESTKTKEKYSEDQVSQKGPFDEIETDTRSQFKTGTLTEAAQNAPSVI